MNLRQMLPSARVELLDPKAQRPSYRLLLQLLVARVQNAYNEANNTGRAWNIDDTTLQVSSGQDEYPLNVSNVGKILDVVYSDPNNVEGTEYQVPFHDVRDLVGDWRNYETASGIAFYYKQGQLYARVRPIPQTSVEYRVSFSVGSWADGAVLEDEPFLLAHHHYFVCGTALDALPAAQWYDNKDERGVKLNELQRTNLGTSLARRVGDYYKQFKLGISGLSVPRMTQRAEAYPIEG